MGRPVDGELYTDGIGLYRCARCLQREEMCTCTTTPTTEVPRAFARDVETIVDQMQHRAALLLPSVGNEISHGEALDLLRTFAVTTIDRLWALQA